jgi:hypothetical protein
MATISIVAPRLARLAATVARWGVVLALLACGGSDRDDASSGIGGAGSSASTGGATPSCEGIAVDPEACNGDARLCALRFDEVRYATTHNAMSNAEDGWGAPNQEFGIERQLEDGVRGFMLDVYDDAGVISLCHGTCGLGSRPLADALSAMNDFLDCHPREVVTLILESYVDAAAIAPAFESSGIARRARAQPLGAPWPTLAELVDADERVVVLTDAPEPGAPAWYLDQFAYAWQNPYAAKSPEELSCEVDRGSSDNALFVLNHFLTDPVAMKRLAEQVNFDPFFLDRVRACEAESGRRANFVTVDFYATGDLFEVVRTLNEE